MATALLRPQLFSASGGAIQSQYTVLNTYGGPPEAVRSAPVGGADLFGALRTLSDGYTLNCINAITQEPFIDHVGVSLTIYNYFIDESNCCWRRSSWRYLR